MYVPYLRHEPACRDHDAEHQTPRTRAQPREKSPQNIPLFVAEDIRHQTAGEIGEAAMLCSHLSLPNTPAFTVRRIARVFCKNASASTRADNLQASAGHKCQMLALHLLPANAIGLSSLSTHLGHAVGFFAIRGATWHTCASASVSYQPHAFSQRWSKFC